MDLALLRLDFIGALETTPQGLPGRLHGAHLLPQTGGRTGLGVYRH